MSVQFISQQHFQQSYPAQNYYQTPSQYQQYRQVGYPMKSYPSQQHPVGASHFFQISNPQTQLYQMRPQPYYNQPTVQLVDTPPKVERKQPNNNYTKSYGKQQGLSQRNSKNSKFASGKQQATLPSHKQSSSHGYLELPNGRKKQIHHKDSLDYSSDASTQAGETEQELSSRNLSKNNSPAREKEEIEQIFEEATVKKPKKHFHSEQERENFVKQYQIKYKTEMCRNWELFGKCKFQDKCSFAHGDHELLKKVHLPSNYKTKLCIQFHTTSFCPYGNRCQFLHSQYDIYNRTDIDNTNILEENTRLSSERANLLKEGADLLSYVNVFPTRRLQVFKNIDSSI